MLWSFLASERCCTRNFQGVGCSQDDPRGFLWLWPDNPLAGSTQRRRSKRRSADLGEILLQAGPSSENSPQRGALSRGRRGRCGNSRVRQFLSCAEHGKFPKLDDSTDLWRVLVTITERKAINQVKYIARKRRSPSGGAVVFSDAKDSVDFAPSPAFRRRRTLRRAHRRVAGRRTAFDRGLEDGRVFE